jgi:hypothetical protein
MARAFEVMATNVTVNDGTKGIRPDGTDGDGRHWQAGSIIELTDDVEIAGLLKAGAIEPVGEKAAQAEAPAPPPSVPATAAEPAAPHHKPKKH